MVSAPAVTVVIVNFNAGDRLAASVGSALADTDHVAEVRVWDNASDDDSIASLANGHGMSNRLRVLEHDRNVGFARGVNRAADDVSTPYLLILNPDCCLQPGALAALTGALEADAEAALAGPNVLDEAGQPEPAACRRMPGPWRSLMAATGLDQFGGRWPALRGINVAPEDRANTVARVEAVSGACMLVRRDAWRTVEGLDEAYSMHFEDLDLMDRLQRSGRRCLFVPDATAIHAGGVSSRTRPVWVHTQKHLGLMRFLFRRADGLAEGLSAGLVSAAAALHWLVRLPWVALRR